MTRKSLRYDLSKLCICILLINVSVNKIKFLSIVKFKFIFLISKYNNHQQQQQLHSRAMTGRCSNSKWGDSCFQYTGENGSHVVWTYHLERRKRSVGKKRKQMKLRFNFSDNRSFHQIVRNDFNCAVYSFNNMLGEEILTHASLAECAIEMYEKEKEKQQKDNNFLANSQLYTPEVGEFDFTVLPNWIARNTIYDLRRHVFPGRKKREEVSVHALLEATTQHPHCLLCVANDIDNSMFHWVGVRDGMAYDNLKDFPCSVDCYASSIDQLYYLRTQKCYDIM